MRTPKLTARDWVEVYYALKTKRTALLRGDYAAPIDDGLDLKAWAAQLETIAAKVAKAVRV